MASELLHRDVAGGLDQRQAESLGPDQLVNFVGQRPRLGGIQLFERLLDLGVDLGAADLAEVALSVGRVNLGERGQRESVAHPTELRDVEGADVDVVGEKAAAGFGEEFELDADLRQAVLRDQAELPSWSARRRTSRG